MFSALSQTATTKRSLGFRTRSISRAALSRSMNMKPNWLTTASKEASEKASIQLYPVASPPRETALWPPPASRGSDLIRLRTPLDLFGVVLYEQELRYRRQRRARFDLRQVPRYLRLSMPTVRIGRARKDPRTLSPLRLELRRLDCSCAPPSRRITSRMSDRACE